MANSLLETHRSTVLRVPVKRRPAFVRLVTVWVTATAAAIGAETARGASGDGPAEPLPRPNKLLGVWESRPQAVTMVFRSDGTAHISRADDPAVPPGQINWFVAEQNDDALVLELGSDFGAPGNARLSLRFNGGEAFTVTKAHVGKIDGAVDLRCARIGPPPAPGPGKPPSAAPLDVVLLISSPSELERMLEQAAKRYGAELPAHHVMLARCYLRNLKRERAERQAESAVAALKKKLDANANDHESRGMLIDATSLLGWLQGTRRDYKRAKETFADAKDLCYTGRALAKGPITALLYKTHYCSVLVSEFDATAGEAGASAERFHLLEQAVSLFPTDARALLRLQLYLRQDGPERDKALRYIQAAIDQGGPSSAIGYMILGNEAWEKDDVAGAKRNWEKSLEQKDCPANAGNNLSWLLAFNEKPPDFDRALDLINAALQKEDKPDYHGTKGHILAKMGRYREALPELEKSKPAYAKDAKNGYDLFVRLSEVCEKLEMREDADRYRKQADDIKAKRPAPVEPPPAKSPR